ncbi:hypothetical protein FQA39_LY05544 [Lamprigera yunnana]|nr:hypothetical protein FQA39_LY05544 [Lamprigera yunnana]
MVYTTKPQTLEELRDQIEYAINDISLATIHTVCRSVPCHFWEYTVAEGGYFEHNLTGFMPPKSRIVLRIGHELEVTLDNLLAQSKLISERKKF